MKTFKQFIIENDNWTRPNDMSSFGGGTDVSQLDPRQPLTPEQRLKLQNIQAARRAAQQRSGYPPTPTSTSSPGATQTRSSTSPRADSTIGRTGQSFAAARELKNIAGLAGRASTLYAAYDQTRKVFDPKDNIINTFQNLGTAIGNQGVPISRQMKYTGSDIGAVRANRRIDAANKYENEKLKAELRGTRRNVISDVGGAGGRVTTNTAYGYGHRGDTSTRLSGNPATITRGKHGERMLRVSMQGPAKPVPFSLLNPYTWNRSWGTPGAGQRYAATLSGHRGTVTRDGSGNRIFTKLL